MDIGVVFGKEATLLVDCLQLLNEFRYKNDNEVYVLKAVEDWDSKLVLKLQALFSDILININRLDKRTEESDLFESNLVSLSAVFERLLNHSTLDSLDSAIASLRLVNIACSLQDYKDCYGSATLLS